MGVYHYSVWSEPQWCSIIGRLKSAALLKMWNLKSLHCDFGVEVEDVYLPFLSYRDFEKLRRIIHQHGFGLLRNQSLGAETMVKIAKCFGIPLSGYRPEFTHSEHPELVLLGNIVENGKTVTYLNTQGVEWHTDGTGAILPPNVTMLYAVEVPTRGGETLFASAVKSYESLPKSLRVEIEGVQVVNSFDHHNDRVSTFQGTNVNPRTKAQRNRNPDKVEPLVQTHPITGEAHLFVTHQMVKEVCGYDTNAGKDLIMTLVDHMTKTERVYTHRWRPGDLIVFDNRSTIHSATPYDYPDQRRLMYQIIVGSRESEHKVMLGDEG